MKAKQDLSFWKLWNLSFGFFGVQIAYALQSANISRIFSTLGADPHDLSYFWILPPLMGIIVQPIIGVASDKTWCRFGRRIPYLFIGALIAVIVMCLLPNAGSLGLSVSAAMVFGLLALMFLDTSINMAMQPFKMLVGDMVNEKQKGLAYSIQSFLCNAGSLVGYLFPFFFAFIGIKNTASEGVIPDSVIYSFYIGAAILIACVIYTSVKVKEMPPAEYAEYHGISQEQEKEKVNVFKLLAKAPSAFWTVGLVQFFCWAAFMFMWTYTNGSIAENVFNTPVIENMGKVVLDTKSIEYQNAANWVGVLFAVQAIGSVLWAICIPMFKDRRRVYSLSLVLGGNEVFLSDVGDGVYHGFSPCRRKDAYFTIFSISLTMTGFCLRPSRRLTSLPSTMKSSVGKPFTPQRSLSSLFSLNSIWQMRRSGMLFSMSLRTKASILHGPQVLE